MGNRLSQLPIPKNYVRAECELYLDNQITMGNRLSQLPIPKNYVRAECELYLDNQIPSASLISITKLLWAIDSVNCQYCILPATECDLYLDNQITMYGQLTQSIANTKKTMCEPSARFISITNCRVRALSQ